jgi:Ca2+/Na+ antiporter
LTGLLWLFFSYGYALYFASNLIGEGSELLLLVPSMAGLVGGVVLPLLGAVPDGAIILFSGLGDKETAQETLSVGVGALAGSTIMLLTIPWAISVYSGRVDLKDDGTPNYLGKPKLSSYSGLRDEFRNTGVTVSPSVQQGGIVMVLTTLPYLLIQIPASFLHGPSEQVAQGEHWWALGGFILCLLGLVYYMRLQLQFSQEGQDKDKRVAVIKKVLQRGQISLSGALATGIETIERNQDEHDDGGGGEYMSINSTGSMQSGSRPPPQVFEYLKEILLDAFKAYDKDKSGELEKSELRMFFKDFHESISEEEMERLFRKMDHDNDGSISFEEFIHLAYQLIQGQNHMNGGGGTTTTTASDQQEQRDRLSSAPSAARRELIEGIWAPNAEEEEEIPEEFTNLSPAEQQTAIKWKAFQMLTIGTVMVIYFSDPMVDVMGEIAVRANMSPFYVSFVLAPLASNASEVLASQYYAAKKTRKTITVSLSALEGAASMNNTFWYVHVVVVEWLLFLLNGCCCCCCC